jgi:hypothetical protein
MRLFISYLLLFSILLPTFSPWGTIAYFRLNRDYIARVLCENRERPQLKCNGKCYLAKMLKKQQDKQNEDTTEMVRNLPVLQLFSQALFSFRFRDKMWNEKQASFNPYQFSGYSSPKFRLLKPPCC